ncbi:MAG: hypothetical protein D3923_15330, partial [Candidatus Electrothrix sp. AR3]|nr:hypothetical protein [Candidatus Electrothrix sp. AR3]
GNVYTTGAITADCTVTANYYLAVNATGQIIVRNYIEDKDFAQFKMNGMIDMGIIAQDAVAHGMSITFQFGSDNTIYSFTADNFDATGNRLIFRNTDGNMLRCIFSKEQCIVKIRYTDIDEYALDALLTGEMTVSLTIGETKYSNTDIWTQFNSRNGRWTKYRKDN